VPGINSKNKSVRLEFRKGLYFEEAIEKALGTVPAGIRHSKKEKGDFWVVELSPGKGTDLEELAGWFSNSVISFSK